MGHFGTCRAQKTPKRPTFNAVIQAPELHLIGWAVERVAYIILCESSRPALGEGPVDGCRVNAGLDDSLWVHTVHALCQNAEIFADLWQCEALGCR
jgi:hypothetical protein